MAQTFPTCPAGQILECTHTFKYDAAGNRNERRAACICVIGLAPPTNTPPTARLANPNDNVSKVETSPIIATQTYTLYPNPTNNNVWVQFAAPVEKVTVQVSNSIGTVIGTYTLTGVALEIPLSSFPAGMYLVTLSESEKSTTQRVIKTD